MRSIRRAGLQLASNLSNSKELAILSQTRSPIHVTFCRGPHSQSTVTLADNPSLHRLGARDLASKTLSLPPGLVLALALTQQLLAHGGNGALCQGFHKSAGRC
ncbi:hypothetical protein LA080_002507 [Diaporthe eres]|nr:hypothetical protein LA080_002507 [Diaporthe eres]